MRQKHSIQWRSLDDHSAVLNSSTSGKVGNVEWTEPDTDNCVRNRFVRIGTRRKKIRYVDFASAGYPFWELHYGHNFNEIYAWCDKNFGKFTVANFGYTFFFQDEKQMGLFILRWDTKLPFDRRVDDFRILGDG